MKIYIYICLLSILGLTGCGYPGEDLGLKDYPKLSSIEKSEDNGVYTMTTKIISEKAITEAGVEYASDYTFNENVVIVKGTVSATGEMSVRLDDLNRSTTYYIRAFAKNSAGKNYSEFTQFTTSNSIPYCSISKVMVSNITIKAATVTAVVKPLSPNRKIKQAGFMYGQGSYSYSKTECTPSSDGTITATIDDLMLNRSYNVYAYAVTDDTTTEKGEITYFNTLTESDYTTISNLSISNIGINSATLSATIKAQFNDSPISEAGIMYSNYEYGNYITIKGTCDADGKLEVKLSNLTAATKYYVKAYAKVSGYTNYGSVNSFTTLKESEAYPIVVCNDFSKKTTTSFEITALVTERLLTAEESGFIYYESSYANPTFDLSGAKRVSLGKQSGTLKDVISELNPNSCYRIRAYALVNGNKPVYSEEVYSVYTTDSKCTPQLDNLDVTKRGNQVAVSFDLISCGGYTTTECGYVYGTSSNVTTTNCIGKEKFMQTANGTKKESSSWTLTKPESGNTVYYFKAYAINEKGTAYSSTRSVTVYWND